MNLAKVLKNYGVTLQELSRVLKRSKQDLSRVGIINKPTTKMLEIISLGLCQLGVEMTPSRLFYEMRVDIDHEIPEIDKRIVFELKKALLKKDLKINLTEREKLLCEFFDDESF